MKKNSIIAIIIVLILIVGSTLFVYFRGNPLGTQKRQAQSQQEELEAESIATNAITIKNQAFLPNQINVGKGTTVVWTNEDGVDHSIMDKSNNCWKAPSDIRLDISLPSNCFQSPILKKDESFNFTFNKAGIFEYICGIHPGMRGKIIVED